MMDKGFSLWKKCCRPKDVGQIKLKPSSDLFKTNMKKKTKRNWMFGETSQERDIFLGKYNS